MSRIVIKRILQMIPTLFFVVLFTFFVTRVIPGDPVAAMVGDRYDIEVVEELREELGLNKPILVQFKDYLSNMLKGDFGKSYYFNVPVLDVIRDRLPNTLVLSVTALVIAITVGMLLGVISAVYQSTFVDYLLTILALFGTSAPVFWVGIMFVLVFSVNLGWLPSFGISNIADQGLWEYIRHLILPCLCLSILPMATFTRVTRSSMIESLNEDYVCSLRAKGIPERIIIGKHCLKNALPPVITIIGIQLASAFSGAVLTENIFSWPGMGTMISSAIDNRDYSLIQATVLTSAIAFVVINLLTDLMYMVINPKVADEARRKNSNE